MTVVLKFGGAALKDFLHIKRVAEIIAERRVSFQNVVVVVSAMGKMTDQLLEMARQISKSPPKREQDMLISVGERISMALVAMALVEENVEAISFTGSQAGIITCDRHSDARIIDVRPERLTQELRAGKVVIVAGFQGVSAKKEITTLGRGGSDTTAVALGIALSAHQVEFYKDVEGLFERDPKEDALAKQMPKLSYQEAMQVIEKSQKKILHPRALTLARVNQMPLYIASFDQKFSRHTLIFEETRGEKLSPQYETLEEVLL